MLSFNVSIQCLKCTNWLPNMRTNTCRICKCSAMYHRITPPTQHNVMHCAVYSWLLFCTPTPTPTAVSFFSSGQDSSGAWCCCAGKHCLFYFLCIMSLESSIIIIPSTYRFNTVSLSHIMWALAVFLCAGATWMDHRRLVADLDEV